MEPEILNKLSILQVKKEEAVRNEDFDIAMELKFVCDRLKILGNELIQLESKKVQAIEGEDFESAKYIKVEIHRIRKELE